MGRRSLRAGGWVAVFALVVTVLGGGSAAAGSPHACAQGRRSITGTLDGADFRVEVPERWNCTLVVYSHGYFPPGLDFGPGRRRLRAGGP